MPILKGNRSLILAAVLTVLLTAPAAAINLEPVDNNRVWLNEDAKGQVFQATCESRENKRFYINSSESSFNGDLDTETLRSQVKGVGMYNLTLNCYNLTEGGNQENQSNRSAILEAVELVDASDNTERFEVENWGKGFVGGKLETGITWGDSEPSTNTEAVSFDLEVDGGETSGILQDDVSDNFEFGDGLTLPEDGIDVEDQQFALNPDVNTYFETTKFRIKDEGRDQILEREADPHIYEWTSDLVGGENPTRRMDFKEALNDEYSYLLEMEKVSGEQNILDPNDFVLTVLVRSKEDSDYVSVDELDGVDEMENKEWLEWSEPNGQVGTHRVTLDNVKELEDLPDRQYKFLLEFDREGYEEFVIDQVLVDKQSEFSGRVVGTQGSGVETVMKLRNPDRNVRIGTGQDGYYSEEINSDAFDSMVLDFYKRGKLSPDSSVVIDEPSLGDNSDLGRGGSAIKFDYWSEPDVDITGVDPVNMMAVKFGYPIGSFDEANVKFNPSGMNPENLQVYECSFWNFEGSSCLGSWEEIDDDGFSVNMGISPPDVHISELEPYTTPSDQDILMNAYVLGTSADTGLRDTLSIDGPVDSRIPRNGSISFTGFIETENGENLVGEGVPVEVELQGPEETYSYSGETNVNGKFVIEGDAPPEPGDYTIEVISDPSLYSGFQLSYTRPLEVYTQRSVSLDVPNSFTMEKGEEKIMEFYVENTGQAEIEIQQMNADGMSADLFSWESKPTGEVMPNESKKAEIRFDIPEEYSDSYPSIDLQVEASSDGQELEDSLSAQIRARSVFSDNTEEENTTDSNSTGNTTGNTTESDQNQGMPAQGIARATGNFIQSTSNLNLALGLVMVLMMIVAGALKRKKDERDGRSSRSGRQRPDISKPAVNGSKETEPPQKDEETEEEAESGEESEEQDSEDGETEGETSDEDEEDSYVDEETGKEFDTKEALELFQEMKED